MDGCMQPGLEPPEEELYLVPAPLAHLSVADVTPISENVIV